jgi:hypothetical protein
MGSVQTESVPYKMVLHEADAKGSLVEGAGTLGYKEGSHSAPSLGWSHTTVTGLHPADSSLHPALHLFPHHPS